MAPRPPPGAGGAGRRRHLDLHQRAPRRSRWTAGSGSEAGYRVDEILFGQNATAVGRTSGVEGEMTISGTTVEAATVTVDMASVSSDESRRDNQFRGRIMAVGTYPTATFTLSGGFPAPASGL